MSTRPASSTDLVPWPAAEVEARGQERAEARLVLRQAAILAVLIALAVLRELVL